MKKRMLAALACAVISACGGGGGGGESQPAAGGTGGTFNTVAQPTAEGLWTGTLAGSTSPNFQLLVLDDGEFWAPYGTDRGTSFLVAGFVQGHATTSGGTLTSADAKDFGLNPPLAGTISASFTSTALSGTVSSAQGSVTLAGSRPTNSTYVYDTPANLQAIVGAWSLTSLAGSAVSLNIAAGGTFTGSSGGCTFSGTITPRASGKNVYNVALTFGAAPCAAPNTTGRGIAVSYPVGAQRQLVIAGVNADRTSGTALFGLR